MSSQTAYLGQLSILELRKLSEEIDNWLLMKREDRKYPCMYAIHADRTTSPE